MSWTVKPDATLTGGTATDLVTSGFTPNSGSYSYPGSGRAVGTRVKVTLSTKGSKANPIENTGVKVDHSFVLEKEGCCTAGMSQLVFDLGVRQIGTPDDTETDKAIARFRAVVNSSEFEAMVKSGTLPQ